MMNMILFSIEKFSHHLQEKSEIIFKVFHRYVQGVCLSFLW